MLRDGRDGGSLDDRESPRLSRRFLLVIKVDTNDRPVNVFIFIPKETLGKHLNSWTFMISVEDVNTDKTQDKEGDRNK